MTPEEAGQRILEGKPWVECGHCRGSGVKFEPKFEPANSAKSFTSELFKKTCFACEGLGDKIDITYLRACRVLKVPLPEHPVVAISRRAAEEARKVDP